MATYNIATPVHSFVKGVPKRLESNKFEKIQGLF